MPGSVELLGNQASVPAENAIRLGHSRDIPQCSAAQPIGDLSERGSLGIGQPQAGGQLAVQNAILGDQVFVAEQQFLIHESGHEGQQTCPMGSIVHGGTSMIATSVRRGLSPVCSRASFDHTGM
jgi:hypothetical protein